MLVVVGPRGAGLEQQGRDEKWAQGCAQLELVGCGHISLSFGNPRGMLKQAKNSLSAQSSGTNGHGKRNTTQTTAEIQSERGPC